MSVIHRSLLIGALAACSSPDAAAPAPVPAPSADRPLAPCNGASKRCGDTCVATDLPALGCASVECAPCSLAHASARCSDRGTCAPADCQNGYGDCNRDAADGCETNVLADDRHCGACGLACSAQQVCRKAACVDRNVADAQAWLAKETEGFCFAAYNQMINLCGDVDFCFDPRFMRAYPTGLAVDVGFDFESTTASGNIVKLGGDCDAEGLGVTVENGTVLTASGFNAGVLQVGFTQGKHLVSYQISPNGSAVYVDGIRAGAGTAPQAALKLRDSCGPGLVLGQRFSYWWEVQQKPAWARMAPFFMQLREGIADANVYSVARAVGAGAGTVLLFDRGGASGSTWTASVGGVTAVGKNALSGDPELDGGSSGPRPTWKPLAQCALR